MSKNELGTKWEFYLTTLGGKDADKTAKNKQQFRRNTNRTISTPAARVGGWWGFLTHVFASYQKTVRNLGGSRKKE